MTGVMERVFQMALLITIMLLVMNLFLATFAYQITGVDDFGTNIGSTDLGSLGGDPSSAIGNEIRQQDTSVVIPATNKLDWNNLISVIWSMVSNSQKVVYKIAGDVDMSQTGEPLVIGDGDPAEQVGDLIILIITMIQLAGAAYLPWAIASAITGGGSP